MKFPRGNGMSEVKMSTGVEKRIKFRIKGTKPFAQHKMSEKAVISVGDVASDPTARSKGRSRKARNLAEEAEHSLHFTRDGLHGHPASAFRSGLIQALSAKDYPSAQGKVHTSIIADAVSESGEDLVLLKTTDQKNNPHPRAFPVPNKKGGSTIDVRPVWDDWGFEFVVEYDSDVLSEEEIVEAVRFFGRRIGLGAGRPGSKNSAGIGFGLFELVDKDTDLGSPKSSMKITD